jgi:hypothetical protein
MDQKMVSTFGITIHGLWISALPAEMTSCVEYLRHRQSAYLDIRLP